MSGNNTLDDKLATLVFHISPEAHITVDKERCRSCEKKPCLICPAACYQWDEGGNALIYNHEGCLECGTCRLICPLDAVTWSYPQKGRGVVYRHG